MIIFDIVDLFLGITLDIILYLCYYIIIKVTSIFKNINKFTNQP